MTPAPDATSPASQVDYGGLIERLEKVECSSEPSDWSGIRTVTTNWHRNPDGPEAAKAIRDLEAENARLRSAPIPAVQSGAVAVSREQWDKIEGLSSLSNLGPVGMEQLREAVLAAPQSEPLPGVREPFTVDDLAQEIRYVDGSNSLGAGALAEALSPFIIERIYQGLVAVSSPPLPGGVGGALGRAKPYWSGSGNKFWSLTDADYLILAARKEQG